VTGVDLAAVHGRLLRESGAFAQVEDEGARVRRDLPSLRKLRAKHSLSKADVGAGLHAQQAIVGKGDAVPVGVRLAQIAQVPIERVGGDPAAERATVLGLVGRYATSRLGRWSCAGGGQ